jgi:hypothetical protein
MPMKMVGLPKTTVAGGPAHKNISPSTIAGTPLTSTVNAPMGTAPIPTWGRGGVAGVTIGHRCIDSPCAAAIPLKKTVAEPLMIVPPWLVKSPRRAAGLPIVKDSFAHSYK